MILFFDTETTGLPINWNAPITDSSNWPRLVQLAWLEYDDNGKLLTTENHITKPIDFSIPLSASNLHGITEERANKVGKELAFVLGLFVQAVNRADCLVAHNLSFDEKIIGAELYRKGISNPILNKKRICTMESTTDFCSIPGNRGFKWPKLSELHFKLFGTSSKETHNALADIQITAKCYWELKRRGFYSQNSTIKITESIYRPSSVPPPRPVYQPQSSSRKVKKQRGSPLVMIIGLACFILPFLIQDKPTNIGGVFIFIGFFLTILGFSIWRIGPFK